MGMQLHNLRDRLRRSAFMIAIGLATLPVWHGEAVSGPRAVVELFTSQGCSSCPPADRLVERLAEDGNVLALSLPVDYWDYLGWKDTLADPLYSARQRAYAAHRGDRAVYTPQIVINGIEHVVGSNPGAVEQALQRASGLTTTVEMKRNKMGVEATISGALPQGTQMATVVFMALTKEEEVRIGRGENAGSTITYSNVVRTLQPIGMWSGGTETFRMPKSALARTGAERCAILVQLEGENGPGAIIGAAIMDWPTSG